MLRGDTGAIPETAIGCGKERSVPEGPGTLALAASPA